MFLYQFKDKHYYEFVLANDLEEARTIQAKGKKPWAKSKIKQIAHIRDIRELENILNYIPITIYKQITLKPSFIGWFDYD